MPVQSEQLVTAFLILIRSNLIHTMRRKAKDMEPVVIFHKDHLLTPDGVNAGAEMATLALARTLVKLGHTVYLAAQLPPQFDEDIVQESQDGIRYLQLGESYNTSAAFKTLSTLILDGRYHLIVASRAQALLESRAEKNILTRLFISHEPVAGALGVQPKVIGRVADKVIAVSEAQRQGLIDAGCDPKVIEVIPNGADLELFREGDPVKRNYNRLIFVGALVMDKGVHLLIEAFAKLRSRRPELTLDIYGSAKMWGREDYFDVSQAASVPGLKFHGAVPQKILAEAYQQAGLLVLPSIWFDSFPLTAVEAQVSGLPVLGSIQGGMKEIVRHNRTGYLLDQVSTDTIAAAIDELTSEATTGPHRLREMSECAIKETRERFSWTNTAQAIVKLCNSNAKPVQGREAGELRVGLVTTWNQRCGLATYASYLISSLREKVVVLAEDVVRNEIIKVDELNVRRCWKRLEGDFSRILRIIKEERLEVIHLNCHYRFFNVAALRAFLNECRSVGVKTIAHVHNPFTIDQGLKELCEHCDSVVVHTAENKLEVVANGVDGAKITVIEHGVREVENFDQRTARDTLGIPPQALVAVTFGFVQVHKGIEEVIQSLKLLGDRLPHLQLYVVGGAHHEDASSGEYLQALKRLVSDLGLSARVQFIEGFVPEEKVDQYLLAADVVVMNYRSQYYEASGAISRALGCRAAVIASTAPTFARLGDAVFHITTGYPLPLALELVLTNKGLRDTLRANAAKWSDRYSWRRTAERCSELYREVRQKTSPLGANVIELRERDVKKASKLNGQTPHEQLPRSRSLNVLFQNRPNAFSQRGGDTVVMERIAEGLRAQGVNVDIDVEGKRNPAEYQLVHLFNFATPEITRVYAEQCVKAGVPYVVTTMYEDLPSFYNQMFAQFAAVRNYIVSGQPKSEWARLQELAKKCEPSGRWENSWTAEHAACLIATGANERATLLRDYPNVKAVRIYPTGCDVSPMADDGELFRKETGLKDFVLCVGRLETRKNQLMLLKALEESELPLVFVTGGFTYQPEYEDLCRKFRRSGKTVFLGRLTDQMLASAYAAARVHALPSWFELPGLVSIEAARLGANVVVTDLGTARDYFGDRAFYCRPDDATSISNAVIEAFYALPDKALRERMYDYNWRKSAAMVLKIYDETLREPTTSSRDERPTSSLDALEERIEAVTKERLGRAEKGIIGACVEIDRAQRSLQDLSNSTSLDDSSARELDAVCNQADQLLQKGDVESASIRYREALARFPMSARPHRGLGVAALQLKKFEEAEACFKRALQCEPSDINSVTGLGSARWGQGNHEEAFQLFQRVLETNPNSLVALTYLINGAYMLNRLTDLETALFKYLDSNPTNVDIRYCLAGCCFKQGKKREALLATDLILQSDATHAGAIELKRLIEGNAGGQPGLQKLEEAKELKDYEVAIQGAKQLIEVGMLSVDERAQAEIIQAECLALTGKLVEAEQLFRINEANRAWQHRALAGRGAVLAAVEKWEEAEAFFQKALAIVPTYDVALSGLGIVSLQRNQSTVAWDYFQRALNSNPENLRALLGIVQIGYPLNRLREVEQAIQKYLEMHPANLSILYAYAGCCYAQGKTELATEQLEKIRIFDPKHMLANELLEKIVLEKSTTGRLNV